MNNPMADLTYDVRIDPWSPETTFRQGDDALYWRSRRGEGQLAYAAVSEVRLYKVRYFGSRATYWRCDLHDRGGRKVRLQAAHDLGFSLGHRRIEDRSAAYIPFIKQLEARIAAANSGAAFGASRHSLAALDAAGGMLFVFAHRLTRKVNGDRAADLLAWLMRAFGRMLKGDRVARANLIAAFPEKSAAEIDRIRRGMWDNLGRVFAEYAHLDRLWDYDPAHVHPGRIVLDPDSEARLLALRDAKGPVLVFGAHCGNWELLAWAVGFRNGETGIVYRPPAIAAIDRELGKIRARSKATFITANAQALFSIRDALRRGAGIGMLVDEHFSRGVDVVFFGRICKATPIFARLARQFDCPIHGGRIVRLPEGKFRLDITDAITAPRDAQGKIDVAATMQMITGIVEGWVREHPEQWLWLQRRWR